MSNNQNKVINDNTSKNQLCTDTKDIRFRVRARARARAVAPVQHIDNLSHYKKINHFLEHIKLQEAKIYSVQVVEMVKARLFNKNNPNRCDFMTRLIKNIIYLNSPSYNTFYPIVKKILMRTKTYNSDNNMNNLIENIVGKKLVLSSTQKNETEQMFAKHQSKFAQGTRTYGNNIVKNEKGSMLYSCFLNGNSNGLSDQYIIYKYKQIIKENSPKYDEFKNWVECLEQWVEKCIKLYTKPNNLKEQDVIWEKIAKDLNWNE